MGGRKAGMEGWRRKERRDDGREGWREEERCTTLQHPTLLSLLPLEIL